MLTQLEVDREDNNVVRRCLRRDANVLEVDREDNNIVGMSKKPVT